MRRTPKKKESKWKQKRNEALYPKKKNNKRIIIYVLILFTAGTIGTVKYMSKNNPKESEAANVTTESEKEIRQKNFKVLKQKPVSPIEFDILEGE